MPEDRCAFGNKKRSETLFFQFCRGLLHIRYDQTKLMQGRKRMRFSHGVGQACNLAMKISIVK